MPGVFPSPGQCGLRKEEKTAPVRGDESEAYHRRQYAFDRIPPVPLSRRYSFILTVTEFPFLILWAYAAYWIEICLHVGSRAPVQVWQSALVAGLLVGLGLNASAHRALKKPLGRKQRKHASHPSGVIAEEMCPGPSDPVILPVRVPRSKGDFPVTPTAASRQNGTSQKKTCTIPPQSPKAPLTMGMKAGLPDETAVDIGMIIRFFLIPFAVSSLSGLTSYAREDFVLVFPRERQVLAMYILIPATLSGSLFFLRIIALQYLHANLTARLLLFNGCICL